MTNVELIVDAVESFGEGLDLLVMGVRKRERGHGLLSDVSGYALLRGFFPCALVSDFSRWGRRFRGRPRGR